MKLAASQIAWEPDVEQQALAILREAGFDGLEVAPTRVAGPDPYGNRAEAAMFAATIRQEYGLAICSLQSLWFGLLGSMFGAEREFLLQTTLDAVKFAKAMGAGNMVFGSPKNRVRPDSVPESDAISFFKTIGDAAAAQGTCFSLEANAAVYGTNFMNTTDQALNMAKQVGSPGCKVNLDFGTILLNKESLNTIKGRVQEINHVHISEPELAMIQDRWAHRELAAILREENYDGYVSIEMKPQPEPLEALANAAAYLAEVFG